ncbi:MAG: F0F1 ATP synthase subunit delta [Rhodocyclaceae bacterium]
MAENVTLARPYAEAAFALARDTGSLDAWATALDRLALVAQDANARDCIANPELTFQQVTQLIVGSAGINLSPEQQNFVTVLVENDRAQLLPEIRDLFHSLKNRQEGVKDATVYSAFPIDDAALARLVADLEGRFGKLSVKVRIDPDLIGGVRVAIGDEVIDASVRGKLAAMAAALQN